jgi:transcriptional/translational regulatory protein YebC/TACO1
MSPVTVYGYHTRLFFLAAPKLSGLMGISARFSRRLMAVLKSVRYEGYGPGGTAVVMDCLTDDPERTAARVRQVLLHHGGYLGAAGAVSYLFNPVGLMIYAPAMSGKRLTHTALQAGAEDVLRLDDGSIEVLTDPMEFLTVRSLLQASGFTPAVAKVTQRASTLVPLVGEEALSMLHLLKALETLDETQNVYTNAEIPDEILAQL